MAASRQVNGVLGGIDTDEYEWSRQPATNHHLILGCRDPRLGGGYLLRVVSKEKHHLIMLKVQRGRMLCLCYYNPPHQPWACLCRKELSYV
ncbi:hypothetical protein BDA96_01G274300 [Sorghum bicolor]|uniref:Uncharacterized protein n=2 Tax=Sorghum bicolor TaxID=4558 RepID=A0A921S0C0_SORBI|nr:hypothetical protein BDA96_01G274300 [Sorghum bicolor]KXG38619.1 hypothetical protein SORBI_3001G258900 [Sorghum bicolor]